MVWWIDSDRYCMCRSKFFYYETSVDVINDRIFQTTNIMYCLGRGRFNSGIDFSEKYDHRQTVTIRDGTPLKIVLTTYDFSDNSNYDKFEIFSLIKSGVNIFNVDRTIHGEDFLQKVKEVIVASENLPEIFPVKYRSPVCLAITMTATEPLDVDESVDIIILKDVNNLKELLDFKNKLKNTSVPLMLWMKSSIIEDMKTIIQFTDGVFLNVINNATAESYLEVIHWCKQAYKCLFYVIGDIIKDYRLLPADDLRVLAVVNEILNHEFDGVMLLGSNNDQNHSSQLVRSLVRAMDVIEKKITHDFYKLIFTIKTPVLPWISASLAASLAAKQCGASAIIVLTTSGMSARWIANASPPCYIIAITTRKETARRLHLYRKVMPFIYDQPYAASWSQEYWNRAVFGSTVALDIGLCLQGSKIVLLAPLDQDVRFCNSLQILSIPLKCDD